MSETNSKGKNPDESGEESNGGVVHQLRNSRLDIVVHPADGDDVFIKAGGDVLLLDEMEARRLADEITTKLQEEATV